MIRTLLLTCLLLIAAPKVALSELRSCVDLQIEAMAKDGRLAFLKSQSEKTVARWVAALSQETFTPRTPRSDSTGPVVSKERFLAEAAEARRRDPVKFSHVQTVPEIYRIDKRLPQVILDQGGIWGGDPQKPDGTLWEHTLGSEGQGDAGTRNYTSASSEIVDTLFENHFFAGRIADRLVLANGESKPMKPTDWDELLIGELDVQAYDGAAAVWLLPLYYAENIQGVSILSGSHSLEKEVISRGFVPTKVRYVAVFQPLILLQNRDDRRELAVHPPQLNRRAGNSRYDDDDGKLSAVYEGPWISLPWSN